MVQYLAFDPSIEINGRTASAFLTNILTDDMAPILPKHGLNQINPDAWYPVQSILDAMSDIADQIGTTSSLVSIGIAAGELGTETLPPAVQAMSLGDFFVQYEKIYQTRHRGGDSGYMRVAQPEANHIVLHARTPYPDDVMYGVIYAYTRFFLNKAGKSFVVRYDQENPRKDDGAYETIMHIFIAE